MHGANACADAGARPPIQCYRPPGLLRNLFDILQVLYHVAQRLVELHSSGWAHLDLKPGNVLRRPRHHSWTLIDFGCAAKIGALFLPALMPSLPSVAPQ